MVIEKVSLKTCAEYAILLSALVFAGPNSVYAQNSDTRHYSHKANASSVAVRGKEFRKKGRYRGIEIKVVYDKKHSLDANLYNAFVFKPDLYSFKKYIDTLNNPAIKRQVGKLYLEDLLYRMRKLSNIDKGGIVFSASVVKELTPLALEYKVAYQLLGLLDKSKDIVSDDFYRTCKPIHPSLRARPGCDMRNVRDHSYYRYFIQMKNTDPGVFMIAIVVK